MSTKNLKETRLKQSPEPADKKQSFFKNKYFKFGVVSFFYVLFVIWIGNVWLLFGLGIIYDMYISKKVHWTFWKKKGVKKQTKTVEWIDAIIFAVIAATIIRTFFIEAFTIPTSSMEKTLLVGDYLFVSKVSYGPKLPNTPLSFPFAHHTLPLTTDKKSYLEWIKMPYKRLAGLGKIKRDDIVVFNFPEGDTVALKMQDQSYYQLCRTYGRKRVWTDKHNFGKIVVRPPDKRENYIKRCVGTPGDKLEVIDGQVVVNNTPQPEIKERQYKYRIITDGIPLNPLTLRKFHISNEDMKKGTISNKEYILPLIEENIEKIKSFSNVKSITRMIAKKGHFAEYIFPHDERFRWNEDNFGPIFIPKKGKTIQLSLDSLPIYERIIDHYEGNELEVKDKKIYINGQEATSYTFKMDYYFMMGDSRHNSADSRFWGFVPEDHIVGKAVFIWLSTDKDATKIGEKIRWNRLFKVIH